jgi:A/G-specific adenine glycosylase
LSRLTEDLLRWYDTERRILPWREEPGPYRTWISEAMLQQTQVATVLPYFERFMSELPTVNALASAPVETVLGLWAGLGYYSRARNLHRAAQQIAERGAFPTTVDGWRELPGVGPYMAGAVVSIAFGQRVPTVDGNIKRVLSRVHREPGPKIWAIAEVELPEHRAGDHNQALMDLGARICRPKKPRCTECPIRTHCRGLQVGDIEDFPTKTAKPKQATWTLACALAQAGEKILLAQRPQEGLLGGLWEPPMFRYETTDTAQSALTTGLERMGLTLHSSRPLPDFQHILTHRKLEVTPFLVEVGGAVRPGAYQATAWFTANDRPPLSTLAKKALASLLDTAP